MYLYQVKFSVMLVFISLLINYLFFLDSETLHLPDIPKLTFDKTLDEEYKKLLSPNLSEVSDISDDENL